MTKKGTKLHFLLSLTQSYQGGVTAMAHMHVHWHVKGLLWDVAVNMNMCHCAYRVFVSVVTRGWMFDQSLAPPPRVREWLWRLYGSQCLPCGSPGYSVITVPSSSKVRLSIALSGDGVDNTALLSDPLLPLASSVPLALMERADAEELALRRLRCGS